ncbi:ABC transporter [Kiloniella spongiae]|uniref:ABC transporter n=1 Tax=Kiloniella spongiae TaxID=1489064 RepID=A0A0H2MEC5_9PROT|nr:ABC transporter ATP-binding protein [Kiloniella spongiae]KLN60718.1 ABC transporter [Kiloniella spongiae]
MPSSNNTMLKQEPIALDIQHLNVYFGEGHEKFRAVKDVSISVAAGGSYGLVGESGSGKSTVLRAVSGLVPSWDGTVAVNGEPISKKREMSYCRTIQMVFQDPYASLHPRHSIDRTLSEPLRLHKFDNIDDRVNQALVDVGLGRSFRFRYPHQLSGGQRQRVAIARALMLEPDILLLDEPTSALDVSVQAEILNLLSDIRKTRQLTYILVTHDLAVVAHMCDEIAVMSHGEIVEVMDVETMRDSKPQHEYTRELLEASEGYQPEA